MSKFDSAIAIGFTLIKAGTEYNMAKGTELEVVIPGPATKGQPYEDEVVAGTVAGVAIKEKKSPNRFGAIYDGIPTNQFKTDAKANIKSAEDIFGVEKILICVTPENEEAVPEYRIVNVADIIEIRGTFPNPDGTVTESVNMEDPEVELEAVIEDVPEGSTLLISGEVANELSLAKSLKVSGANAGVDQGYDQKL